MENINFGHGLILNQSLPYDHTISPHDRLPGIQPLGDASWLMRNDAYGEQMALRDTLWAKFPERLYHTTRAANDADNELLSIVLAQLGSDYIITPTHIIRPDGVAVSRIFAPLVQAGLLVQEDLVIMSSDEGSSLLAGFMAFPAGWRLAEKIGRSMLSIHGPVTPYDEDLNARVTRMMNALRADAPLWRINAHAYATAELHWYQSESENAATPPKGRYLRSERQTLRRLPKSGHIVFSILSHIVDQGA